MLSILLVSGLASFQEPRVAPPSGPSSPTAAERFGRFGPGRVHKVRLAPDQAEEHALLRDSGAVVAELDYGAFRLLLVDEVAFGGRAALRASGLVFRDDYDLVSFDGYVLDAAQPEETLSRMPVEERFGTSRPGSLDAEAGLYVVQFLGPPRDEWLAELGELGTTFVQPVPRNAYVVEIAPEDVGRLAAWGASVQHVQLVTEYQPGFRMTPRIRRAAYQEAGRPLPVTVQIVAGERGRDALVDVKNLALGLRGRMRVGPYVNVQAEIDPVYFHWLATRPAVFAIEQLGTPARRDERQGQTVAGNVTGSSPSGPGYLAWLASHGFDGTQFGSFSVNVVDDATSLSGHPDLPGARVDFEENPTFQTGAQSGHGFLNAHIVAGFNDQTGTANEDAGGFNYGLGIAPWAHVGSTAIFGPGSIHPTTFENTAYGSGARISTNSWTFVDGSDNPIPDYDSFAQTYDFLVRDAQQTTPGNQEYTIVFSAGTDGAATNTVSTPATAKNIVTVGASENDRPTGTDGCGIPNSGADDVEDVIFFSSRGPVNTGGGDGRWKPEIVAPGTHVQAGVPQSNYDGSQVCNQYWPAGQTLYGWSSGTSHSTPAVAGGAALIYQDFLNESLPTPSPALVKALLVNGTNYLVGAGGGDTLPSNVQGMGRMNLERAFDDVPRVLVDQSVVFDLTGETHVIAGIVADVLEPLRVTLVWTDAPGPTTGAPWVNDLDLTVEVGGQTYLGNVFAGGDSTAGGAADTRNNTESVFLPSGTSGSFTVTVTASTIAGDGVPLTGDGTDQDFAIVVYNGNLTASPTAQFSGTPAAGFVPLTVDFTDLSTGDVTGWAWDFGDTGTSTEQNPTHTYTTPGMYTVTLTATGPGGSDVATGIDYVEVFPLPAPGIADGSFEGQTPAAAPATPWSVTFGSGHVVNPDGTATDGALPTDGSNWAEVGADDSNNATPPSNPGGLTQPAVGGAGFTQPFRYADGESILAFDAAFLRNEGPDDPVYNDWMSIDVTDGTTTQNLYYADTFTPTTGTSAKYGIDMTDVASVSVDLASLFPTSTSSTLFWLDVQAGNGEDNAQPSRGYVDDVRLLPPAPVAAFSATPLTGVVPLSVAFTDLSSGGPITAWAWDFGDTGTSTEQSPAHEYAAAGTYTVSLTVTGPGGVDTLTEVDYVVVDEAAPVAAFSGTPRTGVTPLTVDFTDLSDSTGGGPVTSWAWDFGDTETSTEQDPTHVYATAGTYSVTLTVTGPGGVDALTEVDYVVVNEPAPIVAFSAVPMSGVLPLSVDFTDLSGFTGGGPVTSWAWDFGDTATSTEQNPTHVYTAAGSYTVSLTASGPGGVDSLTQVDFIAVDEPAPIAAFSGTPRTGKEPLSVEFTDLSGSTGGGPVTSWAWDFGDTATSTDENPTHVFAAAGTYSVNLTVTGPGGSDSITEVDYVVVAPRRPETSFIGSPTLPRVDRYLPGAPFLGLYASLVDLAGRIRPRF